MIPKATLKLPREAGVYMITCTANGKIYIGSTIDLRRRWNEHRQELNKGTHDNRHLQNTWNKYGAKAFTFTVLEKCECSEVNEREQFYLDQWNPYKPHGFNISKYVGRPMLGRVHSPEARLKIGTAHKGKTNSPEARAKISAALKGKRSRLGATFTDASRAKMSNSHLKYSFIVTAPNGESFEVKSLRQFCLEMGLDSGCMYDTAKGKASHHKGYKAKRIERDSGLIKTYSPEYLAEVNVVYAQKERALLDEKRAKRDAVQRGRKHSLEARAKIVQMQCKSEYRVINPSGVEFIVSNLSEFSRDNDLNGGRMYDVVNGKQRHHKGWTVKRIDK